MNSPLLRTALIMGAVIAALNVVFASQEQGGLTGLPAWFFLAQLLLIPAMLVPLRLFPQAATVPQFARRAGLFALGWAAPFAVYDLSGDLLRPGLNLGQWAVSYVVYVLVFGAIFAAFRRPGR